MKKIIFCLFIAFSGLFQGINAQNKPVKTEAIAELVLKHGLDSLDLGLYPGSLFMQSMSELAAFKNDPVFLNKTLALFNDFKTKKINGRGSLISYEAGGSGIAYLNYLKKADNFSDHVLAYADKMVKNQKRTSEGLMTAPWLKDSLDQFMIDCAFPVTPYLLYTGLAFNKPDYVDFAVFQTLEMFKILKDKNGLIHQGRGFVAQKSISEDNWSRGNGWGAYALAFLVRDLPDTHPRRNEVNLLAKNFFEAILKYQNERGTWHQEMTDPTSYVETSGSGLMLFAIGIAIEKGVLDKSYLAQFKKGLSGYLTYIGEDGSVSYTCAGCLCPGKGTKKEYMKKSWVFNDPHAFGPVVLAFTQAAKMGIKEITPLPTISGQAPKMGSLAFNHDIPRKPQTYVRYMPEGNGNILWENDRIAYRVYGPPAKHRVSSGIDIWTKSVSYPIIDKWYKLNHEGKEYHIERGEGNDFYHVSTGRGTGGTAIWHKGKPYISQTYATYKILKHTETEIAFELKYDPWDVDGMKVWEKKVISMKMGTNLFKVETTFETDTKQPLTVAIGISYDKKPMAVTDKKRGLLTLWESYTAQNNGELGMAVCVKPSTIQDFTTYEKEHYVLLNAKSGKKITYYAGAGWTKNPDFKTQQDWIDYLNKELPTLKF